MSRPLSQLVYARFQDNGGSPRIITLHDHNQYADAVKDYGLAAGPGAHVIGLESYKGVFVMHSIVGYTWFVGPQVAPSPIFFGDALAEIERFLWDEVARQGNDRVELPFLIGVGQGAIMSIAAAAAVPDLLSGVVAIDGFLPDVPGWEPPLVPLDDLPVLLIGSDRPENAPSSLLFGDRLVDTLTAWGADVTMSPPVEGVPTTDISRWLASQSPRHRSLSEPAEQ